MTGTAATPMFVLALGNGTTSHRNAVQAIVRENAKGYWHHLPDVWVVGGRSHKEWADLVSPIIRDSPAKLLVLELPREQSQRMFAYRGPFKTSAIDWLWKTYLGRSRPRRIVKRKPTGG